MVLGAIGHEGNEHRKERGREGEQEKRKENRRASRRIKERKRDGGRVYPKQMHQNRKLNFLTTKQIKW